MMKNWKCVAVLVLAVMLLILPTTAAFAEETATVDTAKLEELLQIANSAKKENYTSESWRSLEEAKALANAALTSNDATMVTAAKSALARALSQIKSMDYSAVENAMAAADSFAREDAIGPYWKNLQDAIVHAQSLYGSGNQAAVDEAAQLITQRWEELQAYRAQELEKKDSPVLWIVLFAVSLAGNLVLAALIVLRKQGKSKDVDNVPLVNYDIDDDVL